MLELKRAVLGDQESLVALMENFNLHEGISFDRQYLESALAPLLRDESLGRIWWIQKGSSRLGYCVLTFGYSLEYGGKIALLDELYLSSESRGKGFGKEVLSLIEAECEHLAIGVIYLENSRKNTRAEALYRKQGFVDQDRFILLKRLPWDTKTRS